MFKLFTAPTEMFTIAGSSYDIDNSSTAFIMYDHFKSGEINVRLDNKCLMLLHGLTQGNVLDLVWNYELGDEFVLPLIVDAIKQSGFNIADINLMVPYVPYARQDRVCNTGESFAIKILTQMINELGFKSVITWDNHSDVSTALFNNVHNWSKSDIFGFSIITSSTKFWKDKTLIAPDAGSEKSVLKLAFDLNLPFVQALKQRDLKTHEITKTMFICNPDDINGKDLLIVDDICDGGRTFVNLAKEIKSKYTPKSISLYITHGIFTYGLEQIFDGSFIDHVYVANLMNRSQHVLACPKLTTVFDV